MKTAKKAVFGTAAALVMILSAGCSKSYTAADIAGTWTNHVLEFDQEWTFKADGTYTKISVMDSEYFAYDDETEGTFRFEGQYITVESHDEFFGDESHTFKVEIIDSNTMTWETDAGKIREFNRK